MSRTKGAHKISSLPKLIADSLSRNWAAQIPRPKVEKRRKRAVAKAQARRSVAAGKRSAKRTARKPAKKTAKPAVTKKRAIVKSRRQKVSASG